eukprot:14902-Heterococcus_DN1.PRE.1
MQLSVHANTGDTAKVCIWHYSACKRALTCIARLPPATRMRSVGAAAATASNRQQQQQQLQQWRNGEATTVLIRDKDAVIAVGEAFLLRGSTLHQPQRQRHTATTATTANNSSYDSAMPTDGSSTSATDMLVDTMSTMEVMRYSSSTSSSSSGGVSYNKSQAAASDSTANGSSSSTTGRTSRGSGASVCARDDDVDKDVYIAAGTDKTVAFIHSGKPLLRNFTIVSLYEVVPALIHNPLLFRCSNTHMHHTLTINFTDTTFDHNRYMPLSVYTKGGERVHDTSTNSNSIASLQHCVPQPQLIEHSCSWKAHTGAVALVAVALSQPPSWYTLGEQDGIQQVRALHGVPLGDFPLPNLSE